MSQIPQDYSKQYQQFINTIVASQQVFALKNSEGYATSFSNELVDEDDEPVEIFCFWSTQDKSKALLQDEWKSFEIDTIDLATFLENWCVGMSNEGLLIGTDFDDTLSGFEKDPLELILDVITHLQSENKTIQLQKFKDLKDFQTQVHDVLNN